MQMKPHRYHLTVVGMFTIKRRAVTSVPDREIGDSLFTAGGDVNE